MYGDSYLFTASWVVTRWTPPLHPLGHMNDPQHNPPQPGEGSIFCIFYIASHSCYKTVQHYIN